MSNIEIISGGVCAPEGFLASGVHCGIRKNKSKLDLAMIYSKKPCAAAGVYTLNKVKGAPITVTMANLKNGVAQAVICNSGNANTCNADGIEIAEKMCGAVAEHLKISAEDVIVASTGVIGQPLPVEPVLDGIEKLAALIDENGANLAAQAIMTTDTRAKEIAASFKIDGKTCKIGGMAKGSGMINPNMATLLSFLTTDAAITPGMLQNALSKDVTDTYNMLSVDGDTSTNDMVCILANGEAGNTVIDSPGEAYDSFCLALNLINTSLVRELARDGEGATKLLECRVANAPDKKCAKTVAKSVISSSLLKAAMFGADANWGRILCAIGYADADFDISKVAVSISSTAGKIDVCRDGSGIKFSEENAKKVLSGSDIYIDIDLNSGTFEAAAWGCDLTYDYVKINGDYRT